MRKLLLTSAAMLGTVAGVASAQTPVPAASTLMMQPSQGQVALPWNQGPAVNNNNNAYGMPSTYAGSAAYGKNAVPTPGTVVIRLNGRLQAAMQAEWSTNNQVLGFKTNPIVFTSYVRLYPGVDGMAANGLRYGAGVELRENFPGSTAQPAPALGSATGAASATSAALGSAAPSGSTYSSGQTIFVRRAFAYLAADNFGLLRLGTGDGVIGLFDPGIFSGAGYDGGLGGLNGAQTQGSGVTGANAVPFVLAQAGAEYGNVKLVYLSPQFFGLDFGVQYAPSMGNGFSSCTTAGFGCNSLTTGNSPTRWYNQVAVGARWQGTFGPVGVGVYAVYETAGKETYFGPASNNGFGFLGTTYDNLSFVNAAGYVRVNTPVGLITASADYIGGAVNGQLAMRPTGGVSQNQLLFGLSWRNGPFVLGTQVEFVDSQGAAQLTGVSQRREFALSVGGNWALAPGLNLFAEYQYEYRHQGGFDFVTNSLGSRTGVVGSGPAGAATWKAGATRDAHGQAILIGTSVSW